MLLAVACPGCGRVGSAPCERCLAQLRPAAEIPTPVGMVGCRALLAYEGPARDLVARIKFRNQRAVLGWLAQAMSPLWCPSSVDVVTWAPTIPAHRRSRGFDHAELLARRVARQGGVACVSLLARRPGPAQIGLDRDSRSHGPAFVARRDLTGASVLLVDDVVTTGSTMAAAAQALVGAGAGRVVGLAAAYSC